jgi:hypothetical protein
MRNAAWKMLMAGAVVNRFHKARILPSEDVCENEIESDTSVVQIRQRLCKTFVFRQHMVTLLMS